MQRIASWKVAFAAAAVAWALAIPSAPWLLGGPVPAERDVLGAAAYLVGAVVCHQKPERSFVLAGRPLPVCARCTGIYMGAAVVALWLVGRSMGRRHWRPAHLETRRIQILAVVSAVPTLGTLAYEWSTGDTPSNLSRAVAGLPLGAMVAWIVMGSE